MVNTVIDPLANPQGNAGTQLYKADKYISNNQTAQNIIKSGRNVHANNSGLV